MYSEYTVIESGCAWAAILLHYAFLFFPFSTYYNEAELKMDFLLGQFEFAFISQNSEKKSKICEIQTFNCKNIVR